MNRHFLENNLSEVNNKNGKNASFQELMSAH